jgi:hypothetical protein
MSDPHRLTTTAQVREIIGAEVPVVRAKLFRELDATARAFIGRSPFLLIATAGTDGRPEVSPKGDPPGFVTVEPDGSLLIPERKGNKLIFTLQNLLANPNVGLIFFVPGTDETLRVQGSVELTADPEVLARLSARGQAALLAIRVKVDTCYFHCAKAFRRSQLWRPETWGEPIRFSFGKLMAAKLGGGAELEAAIDKAVAEDYETGL